MKGGKERGRKLPNFREVPPEEASPQLEAGPGNVLILASKTSNIAATNNASPLQRFGSVYILSALTVKKNRPI